MNKNLGNHLRRLRIKNEFTQSSLADLIGVSNKTISSWENGNSFPDVEMLEILADLFNVSIDELIKGYTTKGESIIIGVKSYLKSVYLTIGIFILFIGLVLVDLFTYNTQKLEVYSIVLHVLCILVHIFNIIYSYFSYKNELKKLQKGDSFYEEKTRYIKKLYVIVNSLLSFFVLTDIFVRWYNNYLLNDLEINLDKKNFIKKSTKLKTIQEIIYGSILTIYIVILIIIFTIPHYVFSNQKLTAEDFNNKMYTLQINKNSSFYSFSSLINEEYKDKNYDIMGIDIKINREDGMYEKFYGLDYLELDLKIETKEENLKRMDIKNNKVTYDYEDNNKYVSIYVEDVLIYTFERFEASNGYVYYHHDDLDLYGSITGKYSVSYYDIDLTPHIYMFIFSMGVFGLLNIGVYFGVKNLKYSKF